MISVMQRWKRTLLAVGTVGAALVGSSAYAAGADTNYNTDIANKATVSYQVGGVTQPVIESSPTGNSTPGVNNGTSTTFKVDRRVNFTVAEVGGAATTTSPGATNAVTVFTITNTTNGPVGFVLTPANTGGTVFGRPDAFDVANLRVFVDANNNGLYDAGTDTATSALSVAEDASVQVLIVADVPNAALNGQAAHVSLTAQATVDGTTTVLTASAGADTAAVENVFADAGNNNSEQALDSYFVQSASLSVAKVATAISDPVNGTTNPKAIPGAVIEYAVSITNTGASAADAARFTDALVAAVTLAQGTYNAGAANVSITNNGATTFCVAEAGGADTNADGCVFAAGVLTVNPTAAVNVGNVAPNNVATFRYRVTIN